MFEKSSFCLLLLIVLSVSAVENIESGDIGLANSQLSGEQVLRQSQNTFIQWILSLLPQRPTLANVTPLTTDSATSTTPATTTTTDGVTIVPEPSSTPAEPSSTTLAAVSTTTSTTPVPSKTTTTTTTTTTAAPLITSTTSTTTAPIVSTTTTTTTVAPPTIPPIVLNPPRNCSDCVCGIANTQKRIVGGQETEVHQYPWMAMLLYGGRFYCAATLINDQYLITASHCVYGFRKERISARLLEHDRKMSHFHKIDRNIVEITTHPKYNFRTYDNDIAILKLDRPVEMTELLHPVCMPTPGKSFRGETAIVTGWGALKVGGPTSDTLQEVQVPIMSQDDCRKTRYGPTRITDNMLCAGFDDGKKDSCQGDSGGPLHVIAAGSREHQVAGVVSWGEGCAKAGFPGVYARVNRYGTWIKTLTRNACLCHSETKKIKK